MLLSGRLRVARRFLFNFSSVVLKLFKAWLGKSGLLISALSNTGLVGFAHESIYVDCVNAHKKDGSFSIISSDL
jgi:hypothetical protein